MNTLNEAQKQSSNMELPNQQAESGGCGSGCNCHSSTSSNKVRWIICAAVLIVAAALVARGLNKSDEASAKTDSSGYAMPALTPAATSAATSEATPEATPVATPEATPEATPAATPEATPTPAASPSETVDAVEAQPVTAIVGKMLGALQELNTVAMESDAVFVYLPGKVAGSANPPTAAIDAAVRTIGAKGLKCGIFTLNPESPDYDKLGPQLSLPGVLTLVKGKGMSATSGEITQNKLVQSFLSASITGGGCSSGCGSSSNSCN